MCPRSSVSISCPRRVWTLTAISLPIDPVGTNSAASFSNSSAARSCRRLTVGSSPKTSSPTSAAAMAARMAAEGRVTVSLRRSIASSASELRSPELIAGGFGDPPRVPIRIFPSMSYSSQHEVVAGDQGVVAAVTEEGVDLVAAPPGQLAAGVGVVVDQPPAVDPAAAVADLDHVPLLEAPLDGDHPDWQQR